MYHGLQVFEKHPANNVPDIIVPWVGWVHNAEAQTGR